MAIAFDAGSSGKPSGTTWTLAHTTSGSNRMLWVALASFNGDVITGMTYNGSAMTQAVKKKSGNFDQWMYLYWIVNPTSGTNNIVASFSSGASGQMQGLSFTGCAQTGQPDGTSSAQNTGSSFTCQVNTTADNCFAVVGYRNSGSANYSAGTNSTINPASAPSTDNMESYYSTAAQTPAGTLSMGVSVTASDDQYYCMASFAPFAPPAVGSFFLVM